MGSELRFDGKVAIVTGAGNGLGRAHALLLASRGAKVVVNDLGGGHTGDGKGTAAADKVVEEIKAAGGLAAANYDSVEDGDKIVQTAMDTFGAIDIVINNAGILRDVSFQKMTDADWDLIYRVHVRGAYKVTKAAWDHMRDKGYGRVVFTSSAAGIYGNFGQVNYAMAKLGLVGMANALAIEGAKKNVRVNVIAPIAGSRMTETVLPKDLLEALKPEFVSPLVAWLCHESMQDTGGLYEVGGGFMGKLRWERAVGKSFRIGRPLSIEMVAKEWAAINDLSKATKPKDITASMAPIIDNLGTKESKGGNDLIDVDEALGYEMPEARSAYNERDVSTYALGVGAARDPNDAKDLSLVYEMHGDGQKVLPSMMAAQAVAVIMEAAKNGSTVPGMSYGLDRILHGEQLTEILAPLPTAAKLTHKARISDIWDKGKHALVVTEVKSFDDKGVLLARNEITTLVKGGGGWGGDRGPSADVNVPPERAPDAVITEKTSDNQALLYRLSGDINPLHVDPGFATAFGFKKPILHGLCTFGFATRHVVKQFAKGGDPRYVRAIGGRFSESVFPGETLKTEMWKEADRVIFRVTIVERDKVCLSNAAVTFYDELPKAKAPEAAKPAAAAAAASSEPISADVFAGVKAHLAANPKLAAEIQTTFQFKLTSPDSAYLIDLKNGAGALVPGVADKADVTLELSDADFMAMVAGKANPQKLFMGGQLKVTGNMMASQKLGFLMKMDPQLVLDAAKARAGAGGGAAAPAPAAAPEGPTADQIFWALGWTLEKNPGLVKDVGTTFQFKLTGPDAAWFLDLKNGNGSLKRGEDKADVTLELSTEDFVAMSSGKANPQKLFMGGKLKIGGNVMASQKLELLTKKVDQQAAMEAYVKAHGGAAAAPAKAEAKARAAAAAPKAGRAKEIFAKAQAALDKTPGLVAEVGGTVQFVIKNPAGAWHLGAALKEGTDKAGTTITIEDDDLAALASGAATAADLHQRGKLRVDGDVRPAHKLAFLKG
ncbi:MAG: SDR family NAD(P)-dependent oxidoreductase [Polyangiaceae bacterium]|nr:SDR family NAD(P)-dependent oxidoreductase [Polyangiaceae bacterium]